ncbi:hypothetical protein [Parasitella parasitica]|uniref:C2H2-type domain-containing protein n=1 Tax=Parasitella parasitica TaxID=35722 RepID=A0A0B7NA29_9FUNG|nr:hypothetical protein [Parasitella parasitica]
MDPTLPNPLVDLHRQKKKQKHHQFQQQQQYQQQQQQFLYQHSPGHFNPDEVSPPLPSLSHLMRDNSSNNRHQMPMNLLNTDANTQMKQHLEATGSKVTYTNINSSPIPTQMYQAALPQQQHQQQQQPMIQTKTGNGMNNNPHLIYQRSVADMYQQPSSSVDSPSFYSNINQDVHTQADPSTTTPVVEADPNMIQPPVMKDQQKIYSFVPLDVISQQKRPRKKFNEVERLYSCTYFNCTKAYGTLNHLNAHVTMQGHGPKRMPIEFKELRRQLKKNKKMMQPPKARRTSSSSLSQKEQKKPQQQKQQQHLETDMIGNEQDDILQHPPPSDFYIRDNHGNSHLMTNQQLQQPQQGFNLYGSPSRRPSYISTSFTPQQQQPRPFQAAGSSATMAPSSSYLTRYPHYNMMQQQQQHFR